MLGPEQFRSRVKIYATDVDEEALAQARTGTYPARAMRAVPAGVRERYFEEAGGGFVFRSDLRRCVIFGRNELVADAPIGRVDLLLCRNTLMYFNAETQARVLQRLHFALADNGLLFLGKAEMLLGHGELFQPVDLRRGFFRKVPRAGGNGSLHPRTAGVPEPATLSGLRHQALAASPVATLLVTADGLLADANQRAESMFGLAPESVGRPFRDLEVSFRPVPLRPYLDQVIADRRSVGLREVEWLRAPDDLVCLDVQIVPLLRSDGEAAAVAIMATDVTRFRHLHEELEAANRRLETAYEELQSTVEELETTNEELQSTVEELETTNAELQSTNEELETMYEEQQSTNDELRVINDELRDRTQELHDTGAFMQAILSSLSAAVVVCDAEFVVKIWSAQAEELWGLRSHEAVGGHLLGLDIGLPMDALRPMVRRLLAGEPGGELRVDAVNRRGRTIAVRVMGTGLLPHGAQSGGAVLVMEQV
ncbi:MAG: CheR family methyltransferase [Sporichthyaceae bacterium]